MSNSPRLTLLILAINAEQELARVLPELHDIGDELVIGIDDTTTDCTAETARRFTDRIYPVAHAGFCGRGRADECMLPHCHGDWVLRIDQDETLSPLWHDRRYVSRLLSDRAATHYRIPRRWVVPPGDRYIANRHWTPDYQLRLMRNIPSLLSFNRSPHAPPTVAGEARSLTDSWILHWDYVWHSRTIREAKVAFYRELQTYTGEEFYLYEGQQYTTRPLDYVYPLPSTGPSDPAAGDSRFQACLEVLDCPQTLHAGETEPILIGIRNCSSRLFYPSSQLVRPANVSLSYHWYTPQRDIYHWEGQRFDLPMSLHPGDCVACLVGVKSPEQPGNYLFQPDLVEEDVDWFSTHCRMPCHPMRVV